MLDMGCGAGHSSISVAEAFPLVTVHAVDCDKTSMDKAAVNISTAVEEKRIRPGQVVTHCCMGWFVISHLNLSISHLFFIPGF